MTASVRSSSVGTVGTGNVSVTKPSGTVNGDLLVAFGFADPDGAQLTAPGGWTSRGTGTSAAGFGQVWTKVAASEGSSYTFTGSGSSDNAVSIVCVQGANTSSPLDGGPTFANNGGASTSSHSAPSVSPATSDALLLCGHWIIHGSSSTFTPPSGMTEQVDATSGWAAVEVSSVGLSSSGATGTKSATSSTATQSPYGNLCVSVAIKGEVSGADVAPVTTFDTSISATVTTSGVTYGSETWTGANGAAWPAQWVEGQTGSSAAATIQGNKGRLASGTQGGESSASRISRRLSSAAAIDYDVSGTWTPDSNDPYAAVGVRCDDALDFQSGYYLNLNKSGTITLSAWNGWTETAVLGSITFAASSGTTYGFRVRAIGNSIKARVWSGSEPVNTWDVDVTDSTITTAGRVGLTVVAGTAAVAHSVDFDSFVATNGQTGSQVAPSFGFASSASASTTRLAAVSMPFTVGRQSSAGQVHTADVSMVWANAYATDGVARPNALTKLRVDISWDGTNWTDVTDRVSGRLSITQGRSSYLDDIGPGHVSFALANYDGAMLPNNPDSPYFPNVKLDRWVRVIAQRADQTWMRFVGWVKSIAPEFPTNSTTNAVTRFTAVNSLGLAASKISQSCWVQTQEYQAYAYNTRYDALVMKGEGGGSSYIDNVTTSPGTKARATVVPYSVIGEGPLSFGSAEGLSVDGAVTFSPSSSGKSHVIQVVLVPGVRSFQFWLKIPRDAKVGTPSSPTNDVLYFGPSIGNYSARLLFTEPSAGTFRLDWYGATEGDFWGTLATGVATDQWVRVSLLTKTSAPNTTDTYYDNPAGFLNIPFDMRSANYAWIGGGLHTPAGMSIAGVTMAHNELALVSQEYGKVNSNVGSLQGRINSWSWINPRGILSTVGTATSQAVATGSWHGRSALEIGQEIARTGQGYIWCRPSDNATRYFASDVCYPDTPLIEIDVEKDCVGTPSLLYAVDGAPTRVTVHFPGGNSTVVDDSLEADAQSARSTTIETIADSYSAAEGIAQSVLRRANLGMRITKLVLDLSRGNGEHIAKLFDSSTGEAGLRPTQRVRVKVPTDFFGVPYIDSYVQGWTEDYDPDSDSVTITLDLSPANPPPGQTATNTTVGMGFGISATATGGSGGQSGAYTSVTINGVTFTLSGINPTNTDYPGGRGPDQLMMYRSPLTTTATNEWGAEVVVSAANVITSINDRQTTGSTSGTAIPSGSYVLSGHGAARDFLLANAVVGRSVTLVQSGGGGGGTTPGTSPWRSTMPWALGVFGNLVGTASSAKVDAFAAMAGVPMDFVDQHPGWATLTARENWWLTPHVNRGYNMMISMPLYGGDGVNADHSADWTAMAQLATSGGFTQPYWRPGVEFNIPIEGNATDANYTQWMTRYRAVVAAIKAGNPGAKIMLCVNEGLPQGISQANVMNIVNGLADVYDILAVDYYDQYDAVTNLSQAQARFGTASTHGTMNFWLNTAKVLGRKLAVTEWGVAQGTQWAGHQGGDNPYYINYLMDWAATNADTVVLMSYFEEPDAYLESDITTTATNPNARAEFIANINQYKGTTSPGGGGGGGPTPPTTGYPAKTVSVYKMMWSVNGPNLGSIPSGVNCIRLAFAQGDPPSLVGWGSQGQSSFLSDLAAKRAAGVKIILSVGGSGGALNPANRTGFLSGVAAIRSALGGGLDGLDWDIEASGLVQSDVVYLSTQLKSLYGSGFAITFVPNGGNVGTYLPAAVACHAAGALDEYGQQFYDAVVSVGAAAGRIQEALNAGLPISKISVGMMVGSETIYWDNAEARSNMQSLMGQFPGLQRAYLWEASRAGTAQWVTDMRSLIGN